MKTFPTLYKRDSNGRIQQWTIVAEKTGYYVVEGLQDGKKTTSELHVCEQKNIGKQNETSIEDQVIKEAEAKYAHKLAHGYGLTSEGVDESAYLEPMLAKQFEDYKDKIEFPVFCDDKLNGVRLNALKGIVRSRKNKPFYTIPHIVKSLAPLFEKWPDLFIDGELFNKALKNHLNRLIELASVAYKPKDLTPELLKESEEVVQFHVYDGYGFDGILPETPFIQRRAALKKLLKGIKYVHVLDYTVCNNEAEVYALLAKAKKENSEGVIIRHSDCKYEHKRSKNLLKLKNMCIEEFKVVDLLPGNGMWSSACKIVVLALPKPVIGRDGKLQFTFNANIEGSLEYLTDLLANKKDYINHNASVRYQELSEFKIPLIPYVEVIKRNYE
jgi:ATP-dependent DNA ligase